MAALGAASVLALVVAVARAGRPALRRAGSTPGRPRRRRGRRPGVRAARPPGRPPGRPGRRAAAAGRPTGGDPTAARWAVRRELAPLVVAGAERRPPGARARSAGAAAGAAGRCSRPSRPSRWPSSARPRAARPAAWPCRPSLGGRARCGGQRQDRPRPRHHRLAPTARPGLVLRPGRATGLRRQPVVAAAGARHLGRRPAGRPPT